MVRSVARGNGLDSQYSEPLSWFQKLLIGTIAVLLGILIGVVVFSLIHGKEKINSVAAAPRERPTHREPGPVVTKTEEPSLPPATAGGNGSSVAPSASAPQSRLFEPGARSSFASLEASLPAHIGLAVAPLGSSPPRELGGLQVGHAWSSFKVPIVATVIREQGSLSAAEESEAAAAITASDNEAAAALFAELGSVDTASAAVERTLEESGYPTRVATAPPPPGAVSTWGQTEWPLASSVGFYRALACDRLQLSSAQTDYVLSLMENVISEQQWGLGQAGIPGNVAFKAGWGPDGSESGPYLVRQAGVLRSGDSGVVVTIAAQDDSGSFEAGVQDLDQIADWVRDHVRLNAGSCSA